MDALTRMLSDLDELRSNATGYQEILAVIDQDEVDNETVERSVQKERSIGLAVLRLANSARFGGHGSTTSLRDAIGRIGFRELRSMVVAHQAKQAMGQGVRAYGLDGEQAWRGALAGGIAAEEAARLSGCSDTALSFTAGLYRDCGKLAIDSLPGGAQFAELVRTAPEHEALLEMERSAIGYDHPTIGAELARLWGLPEPLVQAIQYHHEPSSHPSARVIDCVHCGDAVAAHMGYGTGLDGMRYRIDREALARIDMDLTSFSELLCETKSRMTPYLEGESDGDLTEQEAA